MAACSNGFLPVSSAPISFPATVFASLSPAFFPWRGLASVLFGCLLVVGRESALHAQETPSQERPLSVYLDLRPAPRNAPPQTTPAWVEALEFTPASTDPGRALADAPLLTAGALEKDVAASEALLVTALQASSESKSVFRVRVQRPFGASHHLQVRIFFDDASLDARPRLSVRNALGKELLHSPPLGLGLGLPSSESLLVPMVGAGSLEIETPGDGANVRGMFLTWVDGTKVLQANDFPSDERVRQPFGAPAAARAAHDDSYLYGVVTAGLQDEQPLVLKPAESPGATFQFDLERRPLFAVVTYEVLGATVGAAPGVSVNGTALGASEMRLPDLSDPGFQGESEEGKSQMSFRYTGWIAAQKTIPGDALAAGLNDLHLELSNGSRAVAIRTVSIQLKYNWEKLDYILSPAPLPHETH